MCNITVVFIILALNSLVAAGSGLELTKAGGGHGSRPQRDISCTENQEYQHDNICCLNCPAGSYVQSTCTQAHKGGTCKPCDFDTYTEHDNGLTQCLKCTKCRPDQETVRKCDTKQDTECQCRAGWFCDPDQACEVCKRCTVCKDDEVVVRNCSTTANAVCKRQLPISSATSTTYAAVTAVIVLAVITTAAILICWAKRKSQRGPESHSDPSGMEKVVVSQSVEERQNMQNSGLCDSQLQPFLLHQAQSVGHKASANKEKDNGLGDSLPSTTHSSLSSLSAPPSVPFPRPPPHPSPVSQRQPSAREDDLLQRKLVPLNGDESLKDCFQYFEELDVDYHSRFFRHIGLSENAIKSRWQNHPQPEDRVFELLTVWREKVGMKANINDLIAALLYLNQRLSAENIIAKAIERGHFEYEED